MGEFADYSMQETEEAEFDRLLFRTGGMNYAEAYDRGIVDELGYEASVSRCGRVTCRHCGKACRWLQTPNGWRTGEMGGQIHACPKFNK